MQYHQGLPIDESHGNAGTATGDAFAAWRRSHRALRRLERALVVTIHAGARIETHQDLVGQISAARRATQLLFEQASKGELGASRGAAIGKPRNDSSAQPGR